MPGRFIDRAEDARVHGSAGARHIQLDAELTRYLENKRRVVAQAGRIPAAAAGCEQALERAHQWLLRTLEREYPGRFDGGALASLDSLCLSLQEDLVVMVAPEGADAADAFAAYLHVCAPSGRAPETLVGADFETLHRPVPSRPGLGFEASPGRDATASPRRRVAASLFGTTADAENRARVRFVSNVTQGAELDRCIATCLLEYFGAQYPERYTETIWCDQSYNDLLLTHHAAVGDKLRYTVLNCVKDRLVDKYKLWPGVLHGPADWLKPPIEVSRPEYFFDQTDEEHVVATGCFVPPPQFGDRSLPGLVEDFRQQLNARQLELVPQARSAGQGFVGVKKILATDPFDAPNNVRPKGRHKPTVAAGGDREAYKKAVAAVREYRRQYREAWQSFRRGLEAIFPGGTLLMRHRYRQPCEPLDCWWYVLARCPAAMPPPTPG